MASRWFIRGGGEVSGPLDDARLRSLVAEGKINETTDVAVAPDGPWRPASAVRGLFKASEGSGRNAAIADVATSSATARPAVRVPVLDPCPLADVATSSATAPPAAIPNAQSPPQATEGRFAAPAGRTLLLVALAALVLLGVSVSLALWWRSPEQVARDNALELERRFYLAVRAGTDSRLQAYERSAAVAEAWLVAGDIKKHKEWKNTTAEYAILVQQERLIEHERDELHRILDRIQRR